MKRVEQLTVNDLAEFPIWEFVGDVETGIRPVRDLPVTTLQDRIMGTRVTFGNGNRGWAMLSNVSLMHPQATKHFLAISFERAGTWFHLARYFDVDYDTRGPNQLAEFLGMSVNDIFPIEYDLSDLVTAATPVRGFIPLSPDEELTRDALIQLSLQTDD